MAYEGGGLQRIWNPDVSTRLGAQSAMDSAKFAFLIIAGFRVVVYGIAAATSGLSLDDVAQSGLPASALAAIALLDVLLPLVAAWRLHFYKGAFVVPAATLLYVLGQVMALTIGSLVIGAIFTGVFVGGIRGAWALRRGTSFEDDHYATFG